MKTYIIVTLFMLVVLSGACGPSPEVIVTQTATAATAVANETAVAGTSTAAASVLKPNTRE
jgi:hypothetical protein